MALRMPMAGYLCRLDYYVLAGLPLAWALPHRMASWIS